VPRVLVLCGLRKGAVQAPLGRYLAAPRRQPEGTQFRGGYDVIPAVGDMRLQSQMVTRSTEDTAVPRAYLCTWPSRTRRRRSEGRRPARAASFPLPLAQGPGLRRAGQLRFIAQPAEPRRADAGPLGATAASGAAPRPLSSHARSAVNTY
jgi:hypothetical protein